MGKMLIGLIVGVFLCPFVSADEDDAEKGIIMERYGNHPLSFTKNAGQTNEEVLFTTHNSGAMIFFTGNGATFLLSRETAESRSKRMDRVLSKSEPHDFEDPERMEMEHHVLKLRFTGANPDPRVVGEERLPWNNNYFIGNDPAKWRTDVPNYSKVRFVDVFQGIDLVYYGTQRGLKYDFIVNPGALPEQILLTYDGATGLTPNSNGELEIETPLGSLIERRPYAYQVIDGVRREVNASYRLVPKEGLSENIHTFTFSVGTYNPDHAFFIDPELAYSTFLGGSSHDRGNDIVVDNAGNAYVTGWTESPDFPTTSGSFDESYNDGTDIFICKLNVSGSALAYSTFLGGITMTVLIE